MKHSLRTGLVVLVFAAALLLAGCQGGDPLYDRVPNETGEVLYHDVLGTPASNISFFGVRLGDSEESVRELHGEPLVEKDYKFGRLVNLEYDLDGDNETDVLYHTDRGAVTSVLLLPEANGYLRGDTVIDQNRSEIYSLLGQPTLIDELRLQNVMFYDELGYEVYFERSDVNRIYFTTPNRGLVPAGRESNRTCEQQEPVNARSDGECVEFPNPCLVPQNWTAVDSCKNTAPEICVQVITPAVDTETGACKEYATPCDVPEGWERVSACPDASGMCAQVVTPATNPETGTCVEFPTPCDVPEEWDEVGACEE